MTTYNINHPINAAVAVGGVLTVPYPTGAAPGLFSERSVTSQVLVNSNNLYESSTSAIVVEFGLYSIDITNRSGETWAAGQSAIVSFTVEDSELENTPTPRRLFVVGDSITAMSLDPPSSGFGATTTKGSYFDPSNVKTVGVTNIYAENPCRLTFRAAHNLVTGDQGILYSLSSNHPLASKRYTATVTSATEVTLDGVDATGIPAYTSGAAATDGIFNVDMSYGNYGVLSWFLHYMDNPFDDVIVRSVGGRTTAGVAAKIDTDLGTQRYSHGLIWTGRNDGTFDQVSTNAVFEKMYAKCDTLFVAIPYPDANWSSPANDASAAKLVSIAEFWREKAATYSNVFVFDAYAALSNPTNVLGSPDTSRYLGSDNVHPSINGARLMGYQMASDFKDKILPKVKPASSIGTTTYNALVNGRMGGSGGVVGSGVSGSVVSSFSIGRRTGNVAGVIAHPVQLPARARANSTAYVVGDTVNVDDGFWYVCRVAGTSGAAQPNGYSTPITFTAGLSAATSGTLSAAWAGATGSYTLVFSDGSVRTSTLTNASTAVTWTGAVTAGAAATASFTGYSNAALYGTIADGTATFVKIPKFSDVKDVKRYQFIEYAATSGTSESIQFLQNVALPAAMPVGSFIKGGCDVFVDGRFGAYAIRLKAEAAANSQIACAHALAVNNQATIWDDFGKKEYSMETPSIRVPANTVTLDFAFHMTFSFAELVRAFIGNAYIMPGSAVN